MTKTILLRGGPEDGQYKEIGISQIWYIVLRPLAPTDKMVLLGFERGYYRESEDENVFEWQGWEGGNN